MKEEKFRGVCVFINNKTMWIKPSPICVWNVCNIEIMKVYDENNWVCLCFTKNSVTDILLIGLYDRKAGMKLIG